MPEPQNESLPPSSDEENYSSLLITLTTSQERMILDHSGAGIFKLQDSKIVYANKKAVRLCRFGFIDDLLYKPQKDVFSESFCDVLKNKEYDLPRIAMLNSIKNTNLLQSNDASIDAWVMPSHFHGRSCLQLVFIEKETEEKMSANKIITSEENKIISVVTEALKQNRFKTFYQPIACLTGGNEAHYDVMLRMITPDNTEISAGEFMGEIDIHPISVKIDRWVVLQTIKNLLLSQNQGKSAHLFIHLSSASVLDQNFPPWLLQVIKKSGILPESLIFQIAESTVIKFKKESLRLLRNTRKLGCRTNICHFGLTDQPLASLQEIECDYVKLHNAFTRELADNRNSEQDVRNLIEKLHNLNLKTIVPHVETPKVMTQLWRCGVDYVQGFFLQRPKEVMDYDFSSDS